MSSLLDFLGGIFIDCKKSIACYWNLRSSTCTNGITGFSEEERTVWKQIFEDSLPSSKRLNVLDVGTGAGFLALLFAEMGHEVTGIDLSEGMLEKAKHNAENMALKINFFHADAETLPFEDNAFDLVVNKFLLWTLPRPSHTFWEWKRVLKPGGKIFAIDGDWFDSRPSRRIKRFVSEWIAEFVKKNYSHRIFNDFYEPIKKSLPLFEEISPESAFRLFSETEFINITSDPLLEFQKFKKSRQSFFQKHLKDNSIFMISGQKNCD